MNLNEAVLTVIAKLQQELTNTEAIRDAEVAGLRQRIAALESQIEHFRSKREDA